MTSTDSNTFPRQVEEPRTNRLRDANWPPPFYYEALRIVEQQERSEAGWARQFNIETDNRIEQVRVALAHRAFMRDSEQIRLAKANMLLHLMPAQYVTQTVTGALNFTPWKLPPAAEAALKEVDEIINALARQYGLTLKHPESEIRRD